MIATLAMEDDIKMMIREEFAATKVSVRHI